MSDRKREDEERTRTAAEPDAEERGEGEGDGGEGAVSPDLKSYRRILRGCCGCGGSSTSPT